MIQSQVLFSSIFLHNHMELSEGVAEPKRGGILQSTSKRVRMIFSVMASPNRIDILRILNSKGPLTYSGFKSLGWIQIQKRKW